MKLRKVLYLSTAVLGLLTAGALAPQATHASQVSHARVSYHYSPQNRNHAYLLDNHGDIIPRVGKGDDASDGFSAPLADHHYDVYLNGYYNLWSKPGKFTNQGTYIPRGVKITDKAGTKHLAYNRVPFKGIRTRQNGMVMEVASPSYVGWTCADGLYGYAGTEGRLPIHFAHHAKRALRTHTKRHSTKLVRKHVVKRHAAKRAKSIKRSARKPINKRVRKHVRKHSKQTIRKHVIHKGAKRTARQSLKHNK